MYSDDELLGLSGLQHMAYCPRQWGLIYIDQVWEESAETLRGDFFHERVDLRGYSTKRGVRAERRVHLVSHRLGLYGVADIVEYGMSGGSQTILPVEYKVGAPKASDWDRIQVTAQAMCLEEAYGTLVETGAIFYGETRRRESFDVSTKLRDKVERLAVEIHELYRRGETPRAVLTPKCKRCSLRDACMPETSSLDAKAYRRGQEKKLVV